MTTTKQSCKIKKSLAWDEIQRNASAFSKRWKNGHDEKSEAQSFVRDLLSVFGVEDAATVGTFEERAMRDHGLTGECGRGFMDYFWPKKIAIEMKSLGKNLSDAYSQLKDYVVHLPAGEMPELLMVSDFETIVLNHRITGKKVTFKTKELRKQVRHFSTIAGYETTRVYEDQQTVNVKAAEKMAILHDELKEHGYIGHDLEVFLVRLLFCLFADDTGIFPKDSLLNYIDNSKEDGSDLSSRLSKLFEVLDMSDDMRRIRTLLSQDLLQFRYINGGLFAGMIPSADFDKKMREILLDCCKFDWGAISPAIFGAMFQGVMDAEQRRVLGAHYTSEENILKLINPLFMDSLWGEFEKAKVDSKQLDLFHEKISKLTFLDPACGCGNFLIIIYRELRRLEMEILKMKCRRQSVLDIAMLLKVSVRQFYGIEYEDFPCQIAQAGMWLMEHQMNMQVSDQFGQYIVRLPLQESATIVQGNALRMDWGTVVSRDELSYILGNPPFNGARMMTKDQKDDIRYVFGELRGAGNLDYVTAWYKKAADMMEGELIYTAFVSTNSVTQGEQVAILWRPLMEKGVFINFGVPTFKWNNDARGQAAVHCVIVGFSYKKMQQNINPYLIEGPTVFVESRNTPICDVPEIGIGNKPIDNGNYLFTEEEKDAFLKVEPGAKLYFRKWIGAVEFINGYFRYFLLLKNCPPEVLRKMPECLKRVEAVKNFRLASRSAGTRNIATTPMNFHVENIPQNKYVVIPEVSSEKRYYIPIGFMSPDVLASNKVRVISGATFYHFGILTSVVHMAWVRAISGRLKSDYQYSNKTVYNNFPWPDVDENQRVAIEEAAQRVLNTRDLFNGSSLADLYDPLTMPPELLKVHQKLDRLVLKAYGLGFSDPDERKIVAELLRRYQQIMQEKSTCKVRN